MSSEVVITGLTRLANALSKLTVHQDNSPSIEYLKTWMFMKWYGSSFMVGMIICHSAHRNRKLNINDMYLFIGRQKSRNSAMNIMAVCSDVLMLFVCLFVCLLVYLLLYLFVSVPVWCCLFFVCLIFVRSTNCIINNSRIREYPEYLCILPHGTYV